MFVSEFILLPSSFSICSLLSPIWHAPCSYVNPPKTPIFRVCCVRPASSPARCTRILPEISQKGTWGAVSAASPSRFDVPVQQNRQARQKVFAKHEHLTRCRGSRGSTRPCLRRKVRLLFRFDVPVQQIRQARQKARPRAQPAAARQRPDRLCRRDLPKKVRVPFCALLWYTYNNHAPAGFVALKNARFRSLAATRSRFYVPGPKDAQHRENVPDARNCFLVATGLLYG